MEEVIITVDKNGETVVSTKGFKGSACQDATKEIERALGRVAKDEKTSEYYEKEATRVNRNRA